MWYCKEKKVRMWEIQHPHTLLQANEYANVSQPPFSSEMRLCAISE